MKVSIKRRGGWSLIELTIILVVLSILTAILAPVIGRFARNAKVIRAKEDTQALGAAIWMFIEDTGQSFFLIDGTVDRGPNETKAPDMGAANVVELLVGDGDIPQNGPNSSDGNWFEGPTGSSEIDFFSNHLVRNDPSYRTPPDKDSTVTHHARESSAGFNARFSWRGPYITGPIDPDPWGNRYASNVEFLYNPIDSLDGEDAWDDAGGASEDGAGNVGDTIVVSAGPDEELDTPYNTDGVQPGDDDIVYGLAAGAP